MLTVRRVGRDLRDRPLVLMTTLRRDRSPPWATFT